MSRIKIFIIDESRMGRESLRSAVSDVEDIEIVGESPSGKAGLTRLLNLETDLIIASASLADISASELTKQALNTIPNLGVIISVETDSDDVDGVVKSLGFGAFDYVTMPGRGKGSHEQISTLRRMLLSKIRSFSTAKYSRMAREMSSQSGAGGAPGAIQNNNAAVAAGKLVSKRKEGDRGKYELVVVGVSTGGPEALSKIVPALPASFRVPVVIVLHLPKEFTKSLVDDLNQKSVLTVKEANEGERVAPGKVYLAKGGTHLLVRRDVQKNLIFRVSDEAPRQGCKPSADVLFESAAKACPDAVIAVMLTGMGTDGVEGLRELKKVGAKVIAQDETSSVVWGMPGSAVRANLVDHVRPLGSIVRRLSSLLEGHDSDK